MKKELLESIKKGNVRKFYKSIEWVKKRRYILQRDNYECQKCKGRGKFSKATCVHHKKKLKDYPKLALIDGNLISLCDTCHNEEHPEKLKKIFTDKEHITPERW